MILSVGKSSTKDYIDYVGGNVDLEITSRNRFSHVERNILLRDVPDETTLAELKQNFRIYAGFEEDFVGFAKVVIEQEDIK